MFSLRLLVTSPLSSEKEKKKNEDSDKYVLVINNIFDILHLTSAHVACIKSIVSGCIIIMAWWNSSCFGLREIPFSIRRLTRILNRGHERIREASVVLTCSLPGSLHDRSQKDACSAERARVGRRLLGEN